jgi:ATP-dependent Clp protease protease subunit
MRTNKKTGEDMNDPASSNSNLMDQNNLYLFMDDFEKDTVRPVIEWIIKKNLLPNKDRPKFLTLIICSPGGDLPSAFALIDTMKGSSIPIHTVGLGEICSCGVLVFMSGEKGHRTLTPNTSILSHQYAWGSHGKEHELFARVREFELTSERLINHYRKCTGMSDANIRKYLLPAEDVWLDAKEAIKYGIADSIKNIY